jgi:organic anion transporter 4A
MVVNGFVNVVISTLEKRFGLQSTQTGVIAGCYDIGSMLSVIPIAYFGGRLGSSKPR